MLTKKKIYIQLPDPAVLQQKKSGPLKLSESYIREVGNNFLARQSYTDAFQYFDRAVKVGSESLHVSYAMRASACAHLGRWMECMHDARQAVALRKTYTKGYLLLGGALMELGRLQEALYAFSRGLQNTPLSLELAAAVTGARTIVGEGAAQDFQDARSRGEVALSSGETRDAIKWFSQAICMSPEERKQDLAEVAFQRASCWRDIDAPRAALVDCEEASMLAPNDAKIVSLRGWAHEQLQMYPLALKDYKMYLQLDPSSQVLQASCDRIEDILMRQVGVQEKALEKTKIMESGKTSEIGNVMAMATHTDPDGVQYLCYHYGYW